MITRITRVLLIIQLAAALGLFLLATKVWHMSALLASALAIGSILLVRTLIIANNFVLAWKYRSQTPLAYCLNWHQVCRLFIEEFSASVWSSSWTMAFCAFHKRQIDNAECLPVLLIHGYGCNSGYWHSMSKALSQARISHYAIDLEPIFADIDDLVVPVGQAIEAICSETGYAKIIIVAHSMGGLVARAYLRDYGRARIAKLITLGTPHRGTGLARFGVGTNSKQMHWMKSANGGIASDWLQAIEQKENEEARSLLVSIYSHHDNIVSPQMSSHVPGASNIEFHGIGHVALGLHLGVQARVVEEIQRVSRLFLS